MQPEALEQIQQFLALTDKADLFEYLEIDPDVDPQTVEKVLRRKRSWAQGQQANPKFRTEALWLIKHIHLLTDVLTNHRDAYINVAEELSREQHLDTLTAFIQSTLEDGEITSRGEDTIRLHGEQLGLDDATITRQIDEAIANVESGIVTSSPATDDPEAPDHYATLGADPSATLEELEEAYRARYRWARNLRDTEQSGQIYAQIDEAWRILKDPTRRKTYDTEHMPAAEPTVEPTDDSIGFLPPPVPAEEPDLPTPTEEQNLPESAPLIDIPAATPEGTAPPPPIVPPPDTDLEPETPAEIPDEPQEVAETAPPPMEEPEIEIVDDPTRDPDRSSDNLDVAALRDAARAASDAPVSSEPPDSPDSADASDGDADEDAADADEAAATSDKDVDVSLSEDPDTEVAEEAVRTLDISDLDSDTPVLDIQGSPVIRIRTGSNVYPVRITILNKGEGPMYGTISSSEEWALVSPTELDPSRKEQTVEVLIEPDGIEGNAGQAVIMVDTEHGETTQVTIDVLKHVVSPVMLFVAVLSLVGIVGLFAGFYFSGVFGEQPAPPARTILAINVDPPAGEVYIEDKMVGKQGTMSLVDTFPIGSPFQVRVELDGFAPFTKEIVVPHATQYRMEVDLQLRDPMDFEPTVSLRRGEIDQPALDALLEARAEHFSNCFTRNLRTQTPFQAEITVRCIVSPRGYVNGLSFEDANFRSPAVELCLRRHVRAIHLPLVPGDYGEFTHTFSTTIGLDGSDEPTP